MTSVDEMKVELNKLRTHFDTRMDAQDVEIQAVLDTFRLSKLTAQVIAWLAGVGAAAAVMYNNLWQK